MTWETNFKCEICNKYKNPQINHEKCSKIKQGFEKNRKRKKPAVYSEKRINHFLKLLGE